MSSRLHNKWHRHNHHTNSTTDVNFPDSGHDPIASPESPFQGAFVLNGPLSASQGSQFAGSPAIVAVSNNTSLSATGNIVVNNTTTTNSLVIRNLLRFDPETYRSETFTRDVVHTGRYLKVDIDNQSYYIPLWKA